MKVMKKIIITVLVMFSFTMSSTTIVSANEVKAIDTGMKQEVYAVGQYSNWDGVSTVSQFLDSDGQFGFAFEKDNKIIVVKTRGGKVKQKLELEMKGTLFGAVTCDSDGYYYVVTGKANLGEDTSKNTIFVTKYDALGEFIKSVGDNGRSSLASYYENRFNTKIPFDGGTCDVAINGDYIAVNYGREMYSGHQSNSVWLLDKNTMKTITPTTDYYGYSNYQSHSFGQRVTPYAEGFAFMSEGDCYDRAFTFSAVDLSSNTSVETPIFDFWVKKGTFDSYNMYILNNNFAHIGDICALNNGTVSFVASSVKSLSNKALKQREQLFVQIFNPKEDLVTETAYITTGKRSGIAGKNGDEKKLNYGVKWLTSYKSGSISNPQAVTDGKGNTIILFERYDKNYKYLGVYCIVVDVNGNVVKEASHISKTAYLNSCETPVYSNGNVYWCENTAKDNKLFVYKFKIS